MRTSDLHSALSAVRERAPAPFPFSTIATPRAVVSETLAKRVVKLPEIVTVAAARRALDERQARHVMVIASGRLIGVVSRQELGALPADERLGRAVKHVSVSARPDTSVTEALGLMEAEGIDCLPVVAGAFLLGIVTRDDLEGALLEAERPRRIDRLARRSALQGATPVT